MKDSSTDGHGFTQIKKIYAVKFNKKADINNMRAYYT